MKRLSLAVLAWSMMFSSFAFAQANVRLRGTISALEGDVLKVKSRDGRDIALHLAPDAQVSVAKAVSLAEFKPGAYVGVTSLKRADGRLLARTVHALPPQVPSGHMAWDSIPGSLMTNANIAGVAQVGAGHELTLEYKDGEQKILVTPETQFIVFVPGDRADLRAGETVFSGARVDGVGKFTTQRVSVSRDGVKPPQ